MKDELISYYKKYPPTKKEYTVKDNQHDIKVAEERIDQFDFTINKNT
jgi:hypothetical protein